MSAIWGRLTRFLQAAPGRVKRKYFSRAERLKPVCARLLPDVTCVDVGASYYAHPAWEVFRMSPRTTWIAIEPNASNLAYLNAWSWPSSVIPITVAVSADGGERTLFVTNVESGSSLLEPRIAVGMEHRSESNYFFPVRQVPIMTHSLREILSRHANSAPVAIKIDTQGTELEIVKGLSDELFESQIVCIELETTLAAEPYYSGASRFFAVQQFLEERGFELAVMKPIAGSLPRTNSRLVGRRMLVECDAVFLLRPDFLARRPLSHQFAMLGCYIAYELYGEASHLTSLLRPQAENAQRAGLDALQNLLT